MTPEQARQWRNQIKDTLFVPDPPPPADPKVYGHFEPEPGIIAERLIYKTAYGQLVPAILYRPEKVRGTIPGLVVVNGHGGDKYSWYAFYAAVLYARAGAAVLTYDVIGEGERNIHRESSTRDHDQMQSPPELARRLSGLMISDLEGALSVLAGRPEVNPNQLGAMAYSMGTFVLGLTCALDTRLKTCVLGAGGSFDGPGGYWDASHPMCQGIPYKSLGFLGDRGAVIYALQADHAATLVYNGLDDAIVKRDPRGPQAFFVDLQSRTRAIAGNQGGVFETGFEPNAGHRPWFVTKPVALWLERKLGLPNWTEARISAMPLTHVSAWARANGVFIEEQYATEEREGGVQALGDNIPALTRAQLSVFTPDQWSERKGSMTYESWLERARQMLRR